MLSFTRNLMPIVAFTLLASVTVVASDSRIDYPKDYRNWTHIKSMVIQDGHPLYNSFGGMHHIYANDKALSGYQTGKFPEGSIIVFDLLESIQNDQTITSGNRKVLGVMEKDMKQFSKTAGWGFEAFAEGKASKKIVGRNYKAACFDCHTSQSENDYVFSTWKE